MIETVEQMTETLEQIREWYRYMMTSAVRTGGETDRCLRRMTVLFARIDDLENKLARCEVDNMKLRDENARLLEAGAKQTQTDFLVESLSNPPETVEELRERAKKLLGARWLQAGWDRDFPDIIDVEWESGYLRIADQPQHLALRAAWFAIVGMMLEVGR